MNNNSVINKEIENHKQSCVDSILQMKLLEPGAAFQSKESIKKRIEIQIDESVNLLVNRLNQGMQIINEMITALNREDPETFSLEYPKEFEKLQDLGSHLIDEMENRSIDEEENFSIQKEMGIHEKAMAAFFKIAERLMDSAQYAKAADVLFLLSNLNPYQPNYLIGLGCAEYQTGNYEVAVNCFELAQYVDPVNPWPYLYEAHCFEKLKNTDKALSLVEYALSLIDEEDPLKGATKKFLERLSVNNL